MSKPALSRWSSVLASTVIALAPLAPLRAQSSYATPYAFTTLAGSSGKTGNVDGTGSTARFSLPYGAATDATGNIYVCDAINHTVRKITPGGVVTTLAGSAGNPGSLDGLGSGARMNAPESVAVDNAGNVYVTDTGNHTLRKISPAGVVTTLAGAAGIAGGADGTGGSAQFRFPAGVGVDPTGNVYVADTLNSTVRKITPTGVVTTFAGVAGAIGIADGTGSAARFSQPAGVAVDRAGTVYVADTNNSTIRKLTPAGVVSTLAGIPNSTGNVDGAGTAARFFQPRGMSVDSAGDLYVANTSSHTIRKVTAAGVVTTLAGTSAFPGSVDGTGAAARFFSPRGAAVDSAGNVYVADTYNQTLRKITPAGVTTTLAGLAGTTMSADGQGAAAGFRSPSAVALDGAGNLYVSDTNQTIRKITPAGLVTTMAGFAGILGVTDGTGSVARLANPEGLAVDPTGNVYVASGSMIRKITPAGVVSTFAGSINQGSTDGAIDTAQFSIARGLAFDGSGNLYVGDTNNGTIRKITPAGIVTTIAGSTGSTGVTDGPGAVARFNLPRGVAVDAAGNIYVADAGNHTIRKVSAAGVVSTLAGTGGLVGSADGTGAAARFNLPRGVAVDGTGNVYVADSGNQTIRKITPAGVVTTLAGIAETPGNVDGTGGVARFNTPNGVAVDSAGNLYVADATNNSIRKGALAPPSTGGNLASAISNLSVRTTLAASQTLIMGFTMQGGAKSVLLRAIGPGLGQFGVTGTMPDPKLALFKDATQLDANDNWGGGATLSTAFASVGAFGLPTSSLDAALLRSIEGGHTAQVTGPAGIVLVEAYDAGTGLSPRLTNVSARNRSGTGDDVLIAGFTISGTGPKNLLIRAVGPTLASFGVTGTLADPKLEVFSGATKIAENDTWSSTLAGTFSSVGAFALSAGSRDAALVVTLPPGGYTVQVSGADGGTGEALVELYELP